MTVTPACQSLISSVENAARCARNKIEGVVDRMDDIISDVMHRGETLASVAGSRCSQLRLPSYRIRSSLVRPRPSRFLGSHAFAAIIPGDSAAELVVTSSVFNFLNIYNTLLIGRLVLTWFPSAPQVIVNPLSTICDPYLNLFRNIIPPLGGSLDLSPVLAFLTLNVFTNAAEALPAERRGGTHSKQSVDALRGMKLSVEQRVALRRELQRLKQSV